MLNSSAFYGEADVVKEPFKPNRYLHYLSAGNGLFAIIEIKNNVTTPYYVLTDYQGNYHIITDSKGNKLETLSFDPWGRRRNPTNWSFTSVPKSYLFDRGYTGHEHLDRFGLINMNGRVYDPFLARFLSPDNYVQSPGNSQNFNRYSYAFNNPLIYTDPSGYLGHPIQKPIGWNSSSGPIPWYGGPTRPIGPNSGNHWSNSMSGIRDYYLMTERRFDNFYGKGASDLAKVWISNPATRSDWALGKLSIKETLANGFYWNPYAGEEVFRFSYYSDDKNYINIYYSGQWVNVNKPQGQESGRDYLFPIVIGFKINDAVDKAIALTGGSIYGAQKLANSVAKTTYKVITEIPILHSLGRLTGAISMVDNFMKFREDPTGNLWNGIEGVGQLGFYFFGGAEAELIFNLSTMTIDASVGLYNYYNGSPNQLKKK